MFVSLASSIFFSVSEFVSISSVRTSSLGDDVCDIFEVSLEESGRSTRAFIPTGLLCAPLAISIFLSRSAGVLTSLLQGDFGLDDLGDAS